MTNQFYGPDNRPIGGEKETPPLDLQIQTLVKTEVNTAMDGARDALARDAKADRRSDNIKAWIRYGILLLVNAVIGVALWIYGPTEVRDWTKGFVEENMNKPALRAAAQEVMKTEAEQFVQANIEPLRAQTAELNNGLSNAATRLDALVEQQSVLALANRAEMYDKAALIELKTYAKGKGDVAELARNVEEKVRWSLLIQRSGSSFIVDVERTGDTEFRGPFTNDELAEKLHTGTPIGAVNAIGQKKKEGQIFVPDLVRIAREENDMWVVNRTSKALQEIAGVNFFPWDLSPLDRWWKENSSTYTNWPYSTYLRAYGDFSACKYAPALLAYNEILSVDPKAEKSRAMAVACATELGKLEEAETLLSGFPKKPTRWGEWAQSKMLLTTGTVEAATSAFADLAKRYPTFSDKAWIGKGNHVLRRLDWASYEKSMKEEETSNKAIDSDKK